MKITSVIKLGKILDHLYTFELLNTTKTPEHKTKDSRIPWSFLWPLLAFSISNGRSGLPLLQTFVTRPRPTTFAVVGQGCAIGVYVSIFMPLTFGKDSTKLSPAVIIFKVAVSINAMDPQWDQLCRFYCPDLGLVNATSIVWCTLVLTCVST